MDGQEFEGSGAIDVIHENIRKIDVVFVRKGEVMDGGMGMVVWRAIKNRGAYLDNRGVWFGHISEERVKYDADLSVD